MRAYQSSVWKCIHWTCMSRFTAIGVSKHVRNALVTKVKAREREARQVKSEPQEGDSGQLDNDSASRKKRKMTRGLLEELTCPSRMDQKHSSPSPSSLLHVALICYKLEVSSK